MRLTPHEWQRQANKLIDEAMQTPWKLGDWLILADNDDQLIEARTATLNADPRLEYTELAHYAFVAERIPRHRRRNLPWAYHSHVARLPEPQQDELLDLAESERWTLAELRKAAKIAQQQIES